MHAMTNLGDLFDREKPDKPAIIDLSGDTPRTYSYQELDAMANGVARSLVAKGYRRGDRVAILSANNAEYVAVLYGTMRAGLIPVPVNFKFPRALIHYVIEDSGARLIFHDAARREDCPPDMPAVAFGTAGPQGFDAFLYPGPFAAIVPQQGETAVFLYTSGSTGKPKGVMLSHQSHLWVVASRLAGQELERHRYLIAAPLYHMNALALTQLSSAAHATVVLLSQFTTGSYADAIGQYQCTWLTAVPPMIAMMLRDTEAIARADLSSVEFLRMGSAPVSPSLIAGIHAAMPNAKISNAYGTTEGGPLVFGPHPAGIPQPTLSVGYKHPLVDLRLVDGDNRDADRGQLEMRCPSLMTGYHNRPDLKPPFTDDGFYKTGDVFTRDENGFHYFVGRVDDMFVCGGENIYPSDVEKMLERHPDVAQACVVPIDDEIKGQKPVAFIVPREGATLTEEAVKTFALANAAAYQHPRFVWFLPRLPLATTNKIDRNALIEIAKTRASAALAG